MLELILTLLLGKEKSEKLYPLLTTFKDNGYDLKSTLKSLDISTLMPLITSFTEGFSFNTQNQNINVYSETNSTSYVENFTDLKEVAGQEITDLLDTYFE